MSAPDGRSFPAAERIRSLSTARRPWVLPRKGCCRPSLGLRLSLCWKTGSK